MITAVIFDRWTRRVGVFKNAVTYMQQAQRSADGEDEVDEEQAIEAHQWLYHHHQAARSLDARSIGAAAAIQAYNQFLIHGGPPSRPSNIHLDSQSQVIGMAMAEAVRLFDSTGMYQSIFHKKTNRFHVGPEEMDFFVHVGSWWHGRVSARRCERFRQHGDQGKSPDPFLSYKSHLSLYTFLILDFG